MAAIQEVSWLQASVDVHCLQCEAVLDTPGINLTRKVRLSSTRDGWVIVEHSCPSCGWKPPALTACLDSSAPAPAEPSLIVAPTAEEIEQITEKPRPRKSRIAVPEGPPVEVGELLEHVTKNFPPYLKLKSGQQLDMKAVQGSATDADFVDVTYADGNGNTIREEDEQGGQRAIPNPFHVTTRIFCEAKLPDKKEFVESVVAKINANLKQRNPHPTRVIPKLALNAARSRLKSGCTYPINDAGAECGDTTGGCGHPGMLRNVGSPSGMRAATNLLYAPNGERLVTLQERLDPASLTGA